MVYRHFHHLMLMFLCNFKIHFILQNLLLFHMKPIFMIINLFYFQVTLNGFFDESGSGSNIASLKYLRMIVGLLYRIPG